MFGVERYNIYVEWLHISVEGYNIGDTEEQLIIDNEIQRTERTASCLIHNIITPMSLRKNRMRLNTVNRKELKIYQRKEIKEYKYDRKASQAIVRM